MAKGPQKLFKYLPTCISRSEFVKSRAWIDIVHIFTHNIMQHFGQKKGKLFHHITSAPSNSTNEDILIKHFKEKHFLKMVVFYITW